jgi:hypothetical protein
MPFGIARTNFRSQKRAPAENSKTALWVAAVVAAICATLPSLTELVRERVLLQFARVRAARFSELIAPSSRLRRIATAVIKPKAAGGRFFSARPSRSGSLLAGDEGNKAVESQGDSAVRGCSVAEGAEKVTEEFLLLHRVDAKDREDFGLQVTLVDTDTATADLDTGQNDIVGLGADLAELRGVTEQVAVLGLRAGEGVVDGVPLVLLGIEGKHRKIDDPEEVQGGGIDRELLKLSDAKTDPTEHGAGTLPGICSKEDQVPLLHAEALGEGGLLGVGEELHDGGLPLALLNLDPSQPFRSMCFC